MCETEFPTPGHEVPAVDPRRLADRIDRGDAVAVLDVRAPSEYGAWRIRGETVSSTNVAYYEFLDGLDDELLARVPKTDGKLVVVCAKGDASAYVAGLLAEAGIEAVNLEDGIEGWATVYTVREIERYDGPGTVLQYHRPSSGCLGHLVVHDDEAAVADPLRGFADRYVEDAKHFGAELVYAIDTHLHADHASGVRRLAEADVEAVLPAAAAARGVVDAGEELTVGGTPVRAVSTPGHTTGMTSFLVGDALLLTGDGLFVDSVAHPDYEAGDEGAARAARQLHRSLTGRALRFPDDVLIPGGHVGTGPATNGTYTERLGRLRESIQELGLDEEAFVEMVLKGMPPRPNNYEDIIELNLGRTALDESTVSKLELGPNNYAASATADRPCRSVPSPPPPSRTGWRPPSSAAC